MDTDTQNTSPAFDPKDSTILETFTLENVDQFEAMVEFNRYQILGLLIERPMTGAQIARKLNLERHRIYYHLNLLEEHGLIRFQGERRVRGVIERYYRATARLYLFEHLIKKAAQEKYSSPNSLRVMKALRSGINATFIDSYRYFQEPDLDATMQGPGTFWEHDILLTSEQAQELSDQMYQLLYDVARLDKENRKQYAEDELLPFRGLCILARIQGIPKEDQNTSVEEEIPTHKTK